MNQELQELLEIITQKICGIPYDDCSKLIPPEDGYQFGVTYKVEKIQYLTVTTYSYFLTINFACRVLTEKNLTSILQFIEQPQNMILGDCFDQRVFDWNIYLRGRKRNQKLINTKEPVVFTISFNYRKT